MQFCNSSELISQARNIREKNIGEFTISVFLPSVYDSLKEYKVLYFNDGQTVFGEQGLNVDGSAEELLQKGLIEPVIIVGIHSDRNRTSNYVPYFDLGAKEDFGDYSPDARNYSEKIIASIIPFIEKDYKTKPGNGIAGYSFGGLHATWAALNFPEKFAFSGALSPSFWVKDFEVFKEACKARTTQIYYFDVGTGEWNYYVPMLLHSRLPMLKNIFYYEALGGYHDMKSWRGQRIKNLLLLFAGKTDPSEYSWEVKLEVIKSEYSGKFYPRINPVVTYSNGLACSISYAATFRLLNTEDGVVNKDGSFRFLNTKDLDVSIKFLDEEKKIKIRYQEVMRIMGK